MTDFVSSVSTAAPQILSGSYTVETLPTANAAMVGIYARTTNLFGEKTDLVLGSAANGIYFWQPARSQYMKTISADQSFSLTPLLTPSTLVLSGSLTANRTYTLSTTNAYPGCQFDVLFTGILGVNTLTVAGLDAGGTVSMLVNTAKHFVFDASTQTWKSLSY